jgi:hypothetical protein
MRLLRVVQAQGSAADLQLEISLDGGLSRMPMARSRRAPQNDQLMLIAAFSASSRLFDLNGEASTARTKQISATIAPT